MTADRLAEWVRALEHATLDVAPAALVASSERGVHEAALEDLDRLLDDVRHEWVKAVLREAE